MARGDLAFHARVGALGLAQIVSWGTLYYAIAVLGEPMRASLGTSAAFVFGCFTLGLAVSGLVAPSVGRAIDAFGGGAVMIAGSVVASAAFAVIAMAAGPATFAIGWALAGVAMAMTLYEAAFATLHQLSLSRYRASITALSLLGGFASSVAWPTTRALESALGWRGTCAGYAVAHIVLCVPIYALFLRRRVAAARDANVDAPALSADLSRRLRCLAVAFGLSSFVLTAMVAHLATLLGTRGYGPDAIARVGLVFGPAQVGARALEWTLARRLPAGRTGAVAFALLVVACALALVLDGSLVAALAFALALGGASGLVTIARGTAAADLAGAGSLGEVLGRMSRWALGGRAVAPFVVAAIIDRDATGAGATVFLLVLSALAALGFSRAMLEPGAAPRATAAQ